MIKLSVKGLADYMMASPAAQHTTLRDFKYPDKDEAKSRRLYYLYSSVAPAFLAASSTSAITSCKNWLRSGDGVTSGTGAAGS